MAEVDYILKSVDKIRIAGVRFRGDESECPGRLAELRSKIEPFIDGPAMQLTFGASPALGWDIEVAYPVTMEARPIDGVDIRVLPGTEVVSIEHHGVLAPPEAENSLRAHAAPLFGQMIIDYLVGGTPRRLIHLDPGGELKPLDEEQHVEVQYPLMMTAWLDRLEQGIIDLVDRETADAVLKGRSEVGESTPAAERTAYVDKALRRLDARVADPHLRCRILMRCAHVSPKVRSEEMRKVYEETGSIDALLTHMRLDSSARCGLSWFDRPERVGNTVYITKIPGDPEAYVKATTKQERAAAYCHCPIAREALAKGEAISATFCGCGLGWFPPMWKEILGADVEVELIRSILRGDADCQVAIHLPEGLV
jgi:hypothetical protein